MKKYLERERSMVARWVKKIIAVKLLGGKCKKCGNRDIRVLEFHHIMKDKDISVSKLFKSAWKNIRKELSKCIVICGNCHETFHHPQIFKNKKLLLELKGESKCCKCGYDENNSALVFHHRKKETKKIELSRMHICKDENKHRRKGAKVKFNNKDILCELKKCDVICRNCHLIEHHINMKKFEFLIDKIMSEYLKKYEEEDYEEKRKIELKIKNSQYRNEIAGLLYMWRKEKSIKKIARILKRDYFLIRRMFFDSKIFLKIIKRKINLKIDNEIIIPLTQNKEALINEEDYLLVSKYKWCAHVKNDKHWSAVRTKYIKQRKFKTIKMEREILGLNNKKDVEIIHLNGNGLDNRRINMIIIKSNKRNHFNNYIGSSKYKWVHWDENRNKWFASVNFNEKQRTIGRYSLEEEAAWASDEAYIKYFGNQDATNFTHSDEEIQEIMKGSE